MPMGILFWVIMIVWFAFSLYSNWPADRTYMGSHILLFVLFGLLGWKVFGAPLQ